LGTAAIIALLAGAGILIAGKSGRIPGLAAITGGPTLYALTDADATAIQQNYQNGRTVGGNGNFRVDGVSFADWMHQAILSLRITVYTKDTYCSGQARPTGTSVLQLGTGAAGFAVTAGETVGNAASTTATGFTGFLGSASSSLPIIGTVIGIFSGVLSFMAAHHAAAVKLENSILCPLIPALNQALANAEAAMRNGSANGTQTKAAIDGIVNETMQVIAKDPSSGALAAVGEQIHAVRDGFYMIVEKSGI